MLGDAMTIRNMRSDTLSFSGGATVPFFAVPCSESAVLFYFIFTMPFFD